MTSGPNNWVVNLSAAAASAVTLEFDAPPGRTDFLLGPGPDAQNVDGDTTFAVANVVIEDVNRPDLSSGVPCPGAPTAEVCAP